MCKTTAWLAAALAGLAFISTASAQQKFVIVGIVKAAPANAEEAATLKPRNSQVVYKIVKDDNGLTVARNANNENVRIEGTLEIKNGVKWVTVAHCKIVE